MFAKFDENSAMTLQDIKKTKRYGRTDGRTHARTHTRTHGQRENSIPTTNKVCGGIKMVQKCIEHEFTIEFSTCADPGSLPEGVQLLFSFFHEGREEERIQIEIKVGPHGPASETPF